MDGQHRLEMIKQLPETENEQVLLSIINIKSRYEFDKLIEELNMDSIKNPLKNYFSIFDKQNIYFIKQSITDKYSDILRLPKKSSETNPLYTVSEFTEKISLETNFDPTTIIDILEEKNKTFFDKMNYLEKSLSIEYKFTNRENRCINYKNIIFLKKNNFIDYLINEDIEPDHDFTVREKINKILSNNVWKKEFNVKTNGKCPIFNCKNTLDLNIINSWQCGHIISVFNNGKTELNNLRVICPKCNNQMKHTNWSDYEDNKIKEYIIDIYFDDEDNEIKCKKKNCKNKININNFSYYNSTKTKNIKPCCSICI
jgi:5-methylcytosine-specific restriction endonuclease McrA